MAVATCQLTMAHRIRTAALTVHSRGVNQQSNATPSGHGEVRSYNKYDSAGIELDGETETGHVE